MNRLTYAVFAAVSLVVAIGCGGSQGPGIQSGDRFVVTEGFDRVRFEASYGDQPSAPTHTNGAFIEIPAGTVLEVVVTPRKDARIFEVRPVQATVEVLNEDGVAENIEITDADELRDIFVQERYRTYNFLYYTITISIEDIGTKLKKADASTGAQAGAAE